MEKRVLTGLEPASVLSFFEDLCSIPHGSGNTKALSDYCVRFAKDRGLRYVQDESNNVIIFCNGTCGYEDHPPVVMQGHMDMVCTKVPECTLDMEKEGLQLEVVDGYVRAKGTTLGADDGIALAFALAVMDDPTIPHPPIEAVFTVDEEVGLLGAAALDCSVLKGRRFLNLDSSKEGVMTVGCAGGCRCDMDLPVEMGHGCGVCCSVTLEGFAGGHSGEEINKGLGNPIKLMGDLLARLSERWAIRLQSIHGGSQDNAIPRETSIHFLVSADDAASVAAETEAWWSEAKLPYAATESAAACSFKQLGEVCGMALSEESTAAAAKLICALPNGVQAMSKDIPDLVETSLNIGIVRMESDHIHLTSSVRSSVKSEHKALVDRVGEVCASNGASFSSRGAYPPWEYRKDSPLRDLLVERFRALYGRDMVVHAVHAGLECGLFAEKMDGLDCVCFGPNAPEIHTPRERMEIASVERTWHYLLDILKHL